ncbi:MAG: hypothetical protein MI810_25000 [Flavobacteriales bacterium]|nr:hypothetical protein [Flavobacteriales bacterium]
MAINWDQFALNFLQKAELNSRDELTQLVHSEGIRDWGQFCHFVKDLPYGRNTNRFDFSLVIREKRGSCSSKHALLKEVAERNGIEGIQLILGIYKMKVSNTPQIGDVLEKAGLDYVPEAHCYLRMNGVTLDLTSSSSNFNSIEKDIMLEKEILPEQVAEFKVAYHQEYIRQWIKDEKLQLSFDQLWELREACIANLSQIK